MSQKYFVFTIFVVETTSHVCEVFIEIVRVNIVSSLCFGATELAED